MLLTGADMPSLVPEPDLDWYLPLTVPWLLPGSEPPILRGTFRGDPYDWNFATSLVSTTTVHPAISDFTVPL